MDWIGERCRNLYDKAIGVRCKKKPIDGAPQRDKHCRGGPGIVLGEYPTHHIRNRRSGAFYREFPDASTFQPNCVASCLKAFLRIVAS
jgi:hypothetical protein